MFQEEVFKCLVLANQFPKSKDVQFTVIYCEISPLTVQAERRHTGGTVEDSITAGQTLTRLQLRCRSWSFSALIPAQEQQGKKACLDKLMLNKLRIILSGCLTVSSQHPPRPGPCRPHQGHTVARHWLVWPAVSASGQWNCLQRKNITKLTEFLI